MTTISPATGSKLGPDTLGYRSSGQSPPAANVPPTLHLVGPGRVGCAFLDQLAAQPFRLVAVSDSRATVYAPQGLDAPAIARHKRSGSAIAALPGAEAVATEVAIGVCAADIVVDATDSGPATAAAALDRVRAALRHGAYVALGGKNALARGATELLLGPRRSRLGCNAALGGTGWQLVRELDELREQCRAIALCGNVTTTVIVQAIEQGATVEEGIEAARRLGILEPDPELDLGGSDAAAKLAIAAGAVFGDPALRGPAPEAIACQHVRELEVGLVRARARSGSTTRLVARADRGGRLQVGFEEVPAGSPLAVPPDRVVYTYELADALRVHTGLGIGHDGTARALWQDVLGAEVRR